MIRTEILEGGRLIRTWSDAGFKVLQVDTGIMYDEAVDVNPTTHVYEETDVPTSENERDIDPEEFAQMVEDIL